MTSMPVNLRQSIEALSSRYKQKQLIETSQRLTQRYKNEERKGQGLVTSNIEVATYAIARMPATYGAISAALEYSMQFYSGPVLETLLDIGAGTGAATWAASTTIDTINKFTCFERANAMMTFGKQLTMADEKLRRTMWVKQDYTAGSLPAADLVIAAYTLNELDESIRIEQLLRLWRATNYVLLLVEPGTPVGYKQILEYRRVLLEEGGYILAPCTGGHECPLDEDDWCHFTTRVERSRLHRLLKGGNLSYEDEKFSYVAFAKTPSQCANARVLRHPTIAQGRITLSLCTQEGRAERTYVKRRDKNYKDMRKVKCGDSIEV